MTFFYKAGRSDLYRGGGDRSTHDPYGSDSRLRNSKPEIFMKAGMSWSAITLSGQVEKGIQLMNDPEAVAQMVSAQKKQIHGDAVEKLYEFISGEIQKRNRF